MARSSATFGETKSTRERIPASPARVDFATETGSNHTEGPRRLALGESRASLAPASSPFAAAVAAANASGEQFPSSTTAAAFAIRRAWFAIQLGSMSRSAVTVSATDAATSPSPSRTAATTGVAAPTRTRMASGDAPRSVHAPMSARPARSSPTALINSGASTPGGETRSIPSAMLRPTPPGVWMIRPGVDDPRRRGWPGDGRAVTSRTMPPTTTIARGGEAGAGVMTEETCARRRRAAATRAVGAFRGWALPRGVALGTAASTTGARATRRVRSTTRGSGSRSSPTRRASASTRRIAGGVQSTRAREGACETTTSSPHSRRRGEKGQGTMSSRFAVAKRNLGSIPSGWLDGPRWLYFSRSRERLMAFFRVPGLHPKISPARTTQTRENRFQIIYEKGNDLIGKTAVRNAVFRSIWKSVDEGNARATHTRRFHGQFNLFWADP